MSGEDYQDTIRGNGHLPSINVVADNLAEATHKTILAVHDNGLRIETPKQRGGMTLGYDADVTVTINSPDSQPMIYFPGIQDDARGLMQYILEVTHGIHDHWKKTPENPHLWGYTYHERFIDQIPFVLQRIKSDWDEKMNRWGEGKGSITGRDYQFTIWRPGEDIILEQEDPPCWQSGRLRFTRNSNGEIVMNYLTEWRSRDLLKAWNENNLGQIALMKSFKDKVSNMLQTDIKLGSYTDRSSSLHLYGLYIDRDGLEQKVKQMKERDWEDTSMGLFDYFERVGATDEAGLKRVIAAQMAYEAGTGNKNASIDTLKENYNLEDFPYPESWDSWDPGFDAEPNLSKLSRVQ